MVAALLALPLENLQIEVVDDKSPDGTGQIADRLAKHHPGRIHVLHRFESAAWAVPTSMAFGRPGE